MWTLIWSLFPVFFDVPDSCGEVRLGYLKKHYICGRKNGMEFRERRVRLAGNRRDIVDIHLLAVILNRHNNIEEQ